MLVSSQHLLFLLNVIEIVLLAEIYCRLNPWLFGNLIFVKRFQFMGD